MVVFQKNGFFNTLLKLETVDSPALDKFTDFEIAKLFLCSVE